MTPEELHHTLERGETLYVLDVRNRDEYESWHVTGDGIVDFVVPYSMFMQADVRDAVDELVADNGLPTDGRLVVVCGRGEASDYVARLLREAGYDAENLEGGLKGWARVYVASEVPTDAGATVLQYRRPSSGCLAYLVVSDDEAAVVDPLRAFADRYVEDAADRGADLRYAVDTHVHADHVSGVRDVAVRTGATVVYPEGVRDRGLADADEYEVRFVVSDDELAVGDATLRAVHTPGHTSEMTAFRLDDLAFVGDGLFLESVARPDLESGDKGAPDAARRLHRTFSEVYADFDDGLRVAPGHYSDAADPAADGTYTARLGTLRDRLPALSMDEESFVSYVLDDVPPRPANYQTVVETNLGRHAADDEEAFELELGPNNCAATSATD
jgi:glyoxylase-like metal-dependent hydrolase (beta-lactamase superfamily II)